MSGPRALAEEPRALAALVAWLGPWAPARAPRGVTRATWLLREGAPRGRRARQSGAWRSAGGGRLEPTRLEAYVYEPEAAARGSARREPEQLVIGTFVVAPGLHFDGPADPRFDRFCRVLARAGFRVVAPFLPSYLELLVTPEAPEDLEVCALATAQRWLGPGERLTLFSISFGSWPALEVAARQPELVDAVITFGGYADFHATVQFCADGVVHLPGGERALRPFDPLNPPALFVNLLPWLDAPAEAHEPLAEAWRELAYRTWGRMELKAPGRLAPFVESVAEGLPEEQRALFRVGCGASPGTATLVAEALARAGAAFDFASPREALRRLSCPVVVCHGRDDDVIPWTEAEALHAALAGRPSRLFVTGLYDHTGSALPSPRAAVSEAATLLGLARVLASGGNVRALVR